MDGQSRQSRSAHAASDEVFLALRIIVDANPGGVVLDSFHGFSRKDAAVKANPFCASARFSISRIEVP